MTDYYDEEEYCDDLELEALAAQLTDEDEYEDDADDEWDDVDEEEEFAALVEELDAELGRLEKGLQRSLTVREIEGIVDDLDRHEDFDVEAAYWDGVYAHDDPPDLDREFDRVKHMEERLNDAHEFKQLDAELDEKPRKYDLDKDEDRQAYLVAKMNGEEVEPAA